MARSRNSLLRLDTEVDPAFECLLCGARPYTDESGLCRVADPCDPARSLMWVSHKFCMACDTTIFVCYRYDLAPGGKHNEYSGKIGGLIKFIVSDEESMAEFKDRKSWLCRALSSSVNAPSSGAVSMARGHHVTISTEFDSQVVSSENEWWPEDIYKAWHGDVDTNMKGHTKMVWKGVHGVAIIVRPQGVLLIRPSESSRSARTSCVASASNGMEHFKQELAIALEAAQESHTRRGKVVDGLRKEL